MTGLARVLLFFAVLSPQVPAQNGTLVIQARSSLKPVSQVEVRAGEQAALTNENGETTLTLPVGILDIRLQRVGFADRTERVTVVA